MVRIDLAPLRICLRLLSPLTSTVAMGIQIYKGYNYIKHPVPDWVKLSFAIFDIRTLWRLNPVWYRML